MLILETLMTIQDCLNCIEKQDVAKAQQHSSRESYKKYRNDNEYEPEKQQAKDNSCIRGNPGGTQGQGNYHLHSRHT